MSWGYSDAQRLVVIARLGAAELSGQVQRVQIPPPSAWVAPASKVQSTLATARRPNLEAAHMNIGQGRGFSPSRKEW